MLPNLLSVNLCFRTIMVTEARKLHVIEKILEIRSVKLFDEVEAVLNKRSTTKKSNLTIHDFVGIISEDEAAEMKKMIAETCPRPSRG